MSVNQEAANRPRMGAIAGIAPSTVQRALRLPKEGRVYDLGLELNEDIPQGGSDFVPFRLSWRAFPDQMEHFQYSLEAISGTLHVGTHIDGLAHVAGDGHVYGGQTVADGWDARGWRQLGIESVPPIVGRCVVLDVAAAKGVDRLPDLYEITISDLELAGVGSRVTIEPADTILIRTGKVAEFYSDPGAYQASQPGVGRDAAIWLCDQGMAILGTDTTGTEPLPMPDPDASVHRAMLVDRGVHLIENLYLDQICADGIRGALFVALPLKITGATGSWVRPIAIV
jgi:kynurenine formamidase